jgi:hypothetical protein
MRKHPPKKQIKLPLFRREFCVCVIQLYYCIKKIKKMLTGKLNDTRPHFFILFSS